MLSLELTDLLINNTRPAGKEDQPAILSLNQRRLTPAGKTWSQGSNDAFEYTEIFQLTKGSQQLEELDLGQLASGPKSLNGQPGYQISFYVLAKRLHIAYKCPNAASQHSQPALAMVNPSTGGSFRSLHLFFETLPQMDQVIQAFKSYGLKYMIHAKPNPPLNRVSSSASFREPSYPVMPSNQRSGASSNFSQLAATTGQFARPTALSHIQRPSSSDPSTSLFRSISPAMPQFRSSSVNSARLETAWGQSASSIRGINQGQLPRASVPPGAFSQHPTVGMHSISPHFNTSSSFQLPRSSASPTLPTVLDGLSASPPPRRALPGTVTRHMKTMASSEDHGSLQSETQHRSDSSGRRTGADYTEGGNPGRRFRVSDKPGTVRVPAASSSASSAGQHTLQSPQGNPRVQPKTTTTPMPMGALEHRVSSGAAIETNTAVLEYSTSEGFVQRDSPKDAHDQPRYEAPIGTLGRVELLRPEGPCNSRHGPVMVDTGTQTASDGRLEPVVAMQAALELVQKFSKVRDELLDECDGAVEGMDLDDEAHVALVVAHYGAEFVDRLVEGCSAHLEAFSS